MNKKTMAKYGLERKPSGNRESKSSWTDSNGVWKAARGCFSKRRYRSLYHATECIPDAQLKSGKTLRAYHCSICAGFHLTSKGVNT